MTQTDLLKNISDEELLESFERIKESLEKYDDPPKAEEITKKMKDFLRTRPRE